jgi:tetratricopeptide (TPR) repeat protein
MYAQGAYEEAEKQFKQGLDLVRELDWMSRIPFWLYHLGKVAFRTGDHALAEYQFEESLAVALAFEDPLMSAQNHDVLGRLDLDKGEAYQARGHLQAALQVAIPLGRPPLLLSIFATAAELFIIEKNLEYAALLATFVTNHPASAARVKERANQLLTSLESQFSPDELEKVRQCSQQSDLDRLAAQLVVDLKQP